MSIEYVTNYSWKADDEPADALVLSAIILAEMAWIAGVGWFILKLFGVA